MFKIMRAFLLTGALAMAAFRPVQAADSYLVIDLSGGPSYPFTYYAGAADVPDGVTDLRYKTSHLLLRRIETPTNDYCIGVFEVTQGQWARVKGGDSSKTNSPMPKGDLLYADMTSFASLIHATQCALPNEAQWQTACQAGTTNDYPYGSDATQLPEYAWYAANSFRSVHTVGGKQPNAWGLYDMHGNVEEVCGEKSTGYSAKRGGDYSDPAEECKATSRNTSADLKYPFVGFRLCVNLPTYQLTVINGTGGGDYSNGVPVQVGASSIAHYTFARWVLERGGVEIVNPGDYLDGFDATLPTNTFSMKASDLVLTATYTPVPYTLNVANGTGGGSYSNTQAVAIQANPPDDWYVFDRWVGDVQTVANVFTNSTTVTLPGRSISLTATYKKVTFALTVESGSGNGQHAWGTPVTIAAETPNPPPPWQEFDRWQVISGGGTGLGEGFVSTDATTVVTMPQNDVKLRANYKTSYYTLTLFNCTDDGGSFYTNREVVIITGKPPRDHAVFDRWDGDTNTVANVLSNRTTVTIPGKDIKLTALYRDMTFALTVENGSGDGAYTNGQPVQVTADAPPAWCRFLEWDLVSGWDVGPGFVPADASTWVTMPPRAVTLRATYTPLRFTLTVVNGDWSGSNYTNGQTVAIRADSPAQHKAFVRWEGDTNTVADVTNANTTVTIPGTNITVTAVYADKEYGLTVIGGEGGGAYTYAALVNVTATNIPPWHVFDQWVIDDGTSSLGAGFVRTNAETTVTMPDDEVTLRATYKPILFTLAVVNGDGSGNNYTNGQSVAIRADSPAQHKRFDRWVGDTNTVADVASANTTVVIPGTNLLLTATYSDVPYTLTVYNGTVEGAAGGDGSIGYFATGSVVRVHANAPQEWQMFDRWVVVPSGANMPGFEASLPDTSFLMPGMHLQLTATFKEIPTYALTVNGGTGGGSYSNGTLVAVEASAVEENTFVYWQVSPAGTDLGPQFAASNAAATVRMPGRGVTLTATYTPILYPLTVTNGLGSGSYAKGASVTIAVVATNLPTAGHVFDRWSGSTQLVADVYAPTTTVVMAGEAAALAPVFRPARVLQRTYMVLDLATADTNALVTYRDEPPAGGWDAAHKTTRLVLRRVLAGAFQMGSAAGETPFLDETRHAVSLTKDYYLGVFEVTQKQWDLVTGERPGFFDADAATDDWPVEQVAYADIRGAVSGAKWPSSASVDADSFIGKIRAKTKDSALDLPTEAQWEFACRAGTTGAYAGTLDALAWYDDNSSGAPDAVGLKAPNAWALYDMHGNVGELCLDWYNGDLGAAAAADPKGAAASTVGRRVMRGGNFNSAAERCRSGARGNLLATNAFAWAGLRVARALPSAAYRLTVAGGLVNTGGMFYAGTAIGLSPAPSANGKLFTHWQVAPAGTALGAGFATNQADVLIVMPAAAVTLTAVYGADAPVEGFYRLRQVGPQGTYADRLVQTNAAVQVTAPLALPGYLFSAWSVAPAGAALGAAFNPAQAATTLVMPAHAVTLTATYALSEAASGAKVGVAFTLDAGANGRPATFSAKGLPSGLRIDAKTGVISGVPTRAGVYAVTVTVKKADGATTVSTLPVTVGALAKGAQGAFTGYVYAESAPDVMRVYGALTLSASSAGRLSAKVTTQGAATSFTGKSWAAATGSVYRATLSTTRGDVLELAVDAADGSLTGAFTGGTPRVAAGRVAGQRNAFADKLDSAAQAELAGYLGYYTIALPVDTCVTSPGMDNRQNGSGYLTLTVKARGAVTLAGKLSDGTAFSASTTLLTDGAGAYVPLFVPLSSRRGVLSGLLQVTGGILPVQKRVAAHAAFETLWLYPGSTATATADRFEATLGLFGAYYNSLPSLQAHYGGADFAAEGQAWEVPLAFSATGAISLGTGADNPAKATLKVTKTTGLFSGTFKGLANGLVATLKHAGVLTRDGDSYLGEGAYVVPQKVTLGRVYTLKPSFQVMIETE